jgi:hypothetical protein
MVDIGRPQSMSMLDARRALARLHAERGSFMQALL